VNRPVTEIYPGSLVTARGRDWIVLPQSEPDTLRLRPLGGGEQDESLIFLPLEHEPVRPAIFPWPSVDQARNHGASQLLLDALQLKLRNGAGPFRSFGNIAVEPRAYQLVPLLMALKLATVRLLQLLSDAYFSTQLSCQCIECSHRLLPLPDGRFVWVRLGHRSELAVGCIEQRLQHRVRELGELIRGRLGDGDTMHALAICRIL
jgi:hypothetical protein